MGFFIFLPFNFFLQNKNIKEEIDRFSFERIGELYFHFRKDGTGNHLVRHGDEEQVSLRETKCETLST